MLIVIYVHEVLDEIRIARPAALWIELGGFNECHDHCIVADLHMVAHEVVFIIDAMNLIALATSIGCDLVRRTMRERHRCKR